MNSVIASCSLLLLSILSSTAVRAGEAERQKVLQCYQQGSSTLAQFEQCTGYTGSIYDFRGCLSSNSCFEGQPAGAIPAVQLGLQCAKQANGDITKFAQCTGGDVILPEADQAMIGCAEDNSGGTVLAFATCAAPTAGIKLSDDQRAAIGCAAQSKGDQNEFATCLGGELVGNRLNSTQRDALECASQYNGEISSVAECSAEKIFNANASPEEKIAVNCAAQSEGDAEQFGICAATSYMDLRMNPEQQIAVECVAGTGGQLYATAGCIATMLTGRELEKCLTKGFGGDGCYGNTNDLFGYKGWTARTLKRLAGGPNSVFNNPSQVWGGPNSMLRNPGQIWGGPNSMVRNPGQVFGGQNSMFNNPGQIWGGPNSMFRNPGQIFGGPNSVFHQAPPPVQVGTVGGKRICIPWC